MMNNRFDICRMTTKKQDMHVPTVYLLYYFSSFTGANYLSYCSNFSAPTRPVSFHLFLIINLYGYNRFDKRVASAQETDSQPGSMQSRPRDWASYQTC